jgi:hypothetical protein
MRTTIQALAVCGALIVTANVAAAMAQGQTPLAVGAHATNTSALSATGADAPTVTNSAPPANAPTPVSKPDIRKAVSRIRRAYRKNVPCRDVGHCALYFDSFGAALTFNDGTIAPFVHEQRLERSDRDCIQEARAALSRGDRAMAVQWAMAAYIDDPLTRNWLADHPDAVLEALRHFGD